MIFNNIEPVKFTQVRNKDGLWRVFSMSMPFILIHLSQTKEHYATLSKLMVDWCCLSSFGYYIYFSYCWKREVPLHSIALELNNVMKFLSHQSTMSHSLLESVLPLHNCLQEVCRSSSIFSTNIGSISFQHVSISQYGRSPWGRSQLSSSSSSALFFLGISGLTCFAILACGRRGSVYRKKWETLLGSLDWSNVQVYHDTHTNRIWASTTRNLWPNITINSYAFSSPTPREQKNSSGYISKWSIFLMHDSFQSKLALLLIQSHGYAETVTGHWFSPNKDWFFAQILQ